MLRSMLCLGRDENGHPTDGIDIVSERPKLSTLMTLLQEANRRADKERETANYWHRAYHRLNKDYIALQFEDLCSDCKQVKKETDPGETFTFCHHCTYKGYTVKRLVEILEAKQKEIRYWQDCYETLLHHE